MLILARKIALCSDFGLVSEKKSNNYLRQEIIAVFVFIWRKKIQNHRKHYRQRRIISDYYNQPIRTLMSCLRLSVSLPRGDDSRSVSLTGCSVTLAQDSVATV
jgi:hypothetical protein